MLLSQVFCDHLGAKAASIVSFASESRSRPIGSSSERLCAPVDDCDDARLNLLRDLVKPYFFYVIDPSLNAWTVVHRHGRSNKFISVGAPDALRKRGK